MSNSVLEVKDLCVRYPIRRGGSVDVLNSVSISVAAGEIVGLVGESGAGKSTVGYAIINLLASPGYINSGDIYLNGSLISNLSKNDFKRIAGSDIGFIFQDPLTSLNPLLTIGEQIIETILTHLSLTYVEAYEKSLRLLDDVGLSDPAARLKQYPHQFSGGMRQRIVIAIAISCDPKLIIADEPTTALDVSIQAKVLDLIQDLCKKNSVGCLLITHDMGVVSEITDRIYIMYKGRVVETGNTKMILNNPQEDYSKSLISSVPPSNIKLDRFVLLNHDNTHHIIKDIKSHWLGQLLEDESKKNDIVLDVNDVSLKFLLKSSFFRKNRTYVKASDHVSFQVKKGETFGLVGESGSGKSTIARIIAGLYAPDSGSISFYGKDVHKKELSYAESLRIQMIFQSPYSSMNPRMKIFDIVSEPIRYHKLIIDKTFLNSIVFELLDLVGLTRDSIHKYPHEFSGGQRQRISIARALATRPSFLICDEPTSALDVSVQAQILNLLKDLQQELDLTMLFISHDLPVIRQMCDRIAVMKSGCIVECLETETLFCAAKNTYTQDLIRFMPQFNAS